MNPSAAVSEHNYETNHPSSTVKLRIEPWVFFLTKKNRERKGTVLSFDLKELFTILY